MYNNLESLSLKGKTALVTGASGLIGRAISIKLAELGADVYVHYNTSEERGIETAGLVEKTGQKAYLVSGDLTKPDEVKNIFRIVEETTKRLDILVNNAGDKASAYTKMLKESDWDRMIDSNLKTQYLCTKYACNLLINSNSSCVVNIASIMGIKAYVAQLSCCTSKASIIGMTRALAKELGEYGIRVNAISPGHVKAHVDREENQSSFDVFLATLGVGKVLSEKDINSFIELTPLHRMATADDVANAVVFLSSSMSKCISGLNLILDGGYTLDWIING